METNSKWPADDEETMFTMFHIV